MLDNIIVHNTFFMKTNLSYILCNILFIFSFFQAQTQNVGIGTMSPHSSAKLDISSTTSGLLIPRMTTAQRTAIATPETGLLVFDNSTISFWFYNGTVWRELKPNNPLIDQDSDTKVDVEETADEDIIRFDLGGTERWRMRNNTLENSNTNRNVLIGQNTGLSSTGFFGYAGNTLIGDNVGTGLTFHQSNTIVGDRALQNATSNRNSALGGLALNAATSGGDNVAVGYSSLSSLTTGTENTGIGNYALSGLQAGMRNIALGNYAGASSLGRTTNYGVYIGNYAGYNSSRDHLLYIQNHTATPALESVPLIWGDFLNDSVRINGRLTIGSAAAGTGDGSNLYTFPTTDGTAGQALVTNGAGQVSWGIGADNLGNHTAIKNIQTNNYWISNDGGTEGVFVNPTGNVGIGMQPSQLFQVGGVTSSSYSTDIIASGAASGSGPSPILAADNTASTWFTNVGAQLGFWQYDFGAGNEQTIAQYSLVTASFSPFTAWNFEASNDGITWTTLDVQTTIPSTTAGAPSIYPIANTTPYRYYRVNFTAATGTQSSIIEIEMMTQNITYGDVFSVTSGGAVTINKNYTLPTTDGTANQFLQTDGAGNVNWGNVAATTPTKLVDADNDTKVDVEESLDEDIIRFDLAGTEQWRMVNDRLEPSNTSANVYIGQNVTPNPALITSPSLPPVSNVLIGTNAGLANYSSADNVGVGTNALRNMTGGAYNVALGMNSLASTINGVSNVGVGFSALPANTSGGYNIGIGESALPDNTTGGGNIALGTVAGISNVTGSNNIFIGHQSGKDKPGSNQLYIESHPSGIPFGVIPTPLIWGHFTDDSVRVNGTLAIGNPVNGANVYVFPATDGTANQLLRTDGAGNVSWAGLEAPATPVYLPNWQSYGFGYTPPRYYKTADGRVILEGLIRKTSAVNAGEVLFTLPIGYRPTGRLIYHADSENGGIRVDIDNAGNVYVLSTFNTGQNWISLTGISFRTDL